MLQNQFLNPKKGVRVKLFDMAFDVINPKKSSRYAASVPAFYEALDLITQSGREFDYKWVEIGHRKFLETMGETGNKVNDLDFAFISVSMQVLWTRYQREVKSLNAVKNYTPEVQHKLQLAFAEEIYAFPIEYSGSFQERIEVVVLLETCLRTCVHKNPFLHNTIFEVILVLWCNFLNSKRA